MSNTATSIGPDAERGGNDSPGNADGCGNKTLGEKAPQQPPAGREPAPSAAEPGTAARDEERQ
ncbi:hypothetical protein [Caenimonas sedimenti]|uniref:hypothetical protein n=1 Tax=Caenimonas sedimenti TaxID=2596921 RepID=UPI001646F125|nr:hypothetical protein [Caenimonas sedimenti]